MKKNELLKNQDGTQIIRVLEIQDERLLVIDCIKRRMPEWDAREQYSGWESMTEQELWERCTAKPIHKAGSNKESVQEPEQLIRVLVDKAKREGVEILGLLAENIQVEVVYV